MMPTGNPIAVGWKHNNAPGIRFQENARGQMELTAWPDALGPLPTQADLDTWAVEYAARDAKGDEATAVLADAKGQGFIDVAWDMDKRLAALELRAAPSRADTAAKVHAAVKARV